MGDVYVELGVVFRWFWTLLHVKLCSGCVLKRSLSKVTFIHFLFEWLIARSFYGKIV